MRGEVSRVVVVVCLALVAAWHFVAVRPVAAKAVTSLSQATAQGAATEQQARAARPLARPIAKSKAPQIVMDRDVTMDDIAPPPPANECNPGLPECQNGESCSRCTTGGCGQRSPAVQQWSRVRRASYVAAGAGCASCAGAVALGRRGVAARGPVRRAIRNRPRLLRRIFGRR